MITFLATSNTNPPKVLHFMGVSQNVEGEKYKRNAILFNVLLVFDISDTSLDKINAASFSEDAKKLLLLKRNGQFFNFFNNSFFEKKTYSILFFRNNETN